MSILSILNNRAVEIFIIFFGIGFTLCGASIIFNSLKSSRRWLFRFGGDSPFRYGSKTRWASWFALSYVFALTSSCHPNIGARMYLEMFLSLYQACAMTLGLYIADRIGMMAEPASYWTLEKTKAEPDIAPTPEKEPEKIWLKESVDEVAKTVVETAREASDRVAQSAATTVQSSHNAITRIIDSIRKRKEDKERAKTAEAEKERKRLADLLKGF